MDHRTPVEIVLICNPRAGGRWKELAAILDSEEGRAVRRIVTDSVDDIGPAIGDLGSGAKLLCIYGGDGTIQRILDHLSPTQHESVQLAFLGGGTMNVTARWCGLTRSPAHNFREVVRAHLGGQLLFRETRLLDVVTDGRSYRGFTFGVGPIVRLLDAYERGNKGYVAAMATAARGVAAALSGFPTDSARLLEQLDARILVDGERLPFRRYCAVFANVTGQINPGVLPFVDPPTRDTFRYVAYAVSAREFTLNVLALMRGWLPVGLASLLRPGRMLRRVADTGLVKESLPTDPRYVNHNGGRMELACDEQLFTIDGEIFSSDSGRFVISLGLPVRVAVSSHTTVRKASSMVARRYLGRQ